MIHYQDKTFCKFWKECGTYPDVDCPKALTEEIEEEAVVIGLGVAQYIEKPDCFEELPF